jgi:ferritin-like metal-binding protein YciE
MFERLNTPEEIFHLQAWIRSDDGAEARRGSRGAGGASEPHEVKRALGEHREETSQHVANVEQCFKLLGEEVDDSPCPVIEAMAKDGKATIKKTDDSLVDAVILAAVTESEHYEIAVYETLITNAEARGASEVASVLRQNLEQ